MKQQTEIVQELEDNDTSSDSLNNSSTTNIVSSCAPNPEEILEGEPDDISNSFDRLGVCIFFKQSVACADIEILKCNYNSDKQMSAIIQVFTITNNNFQLSYKETWNMYKF